jgi:hypothetical protein
MNQKLNYKCSYYKLSATEDFQNWNLRRLLCLNTGTQRFSMHYRVIKK